MHRHAPNKPKMCTGTHVLAHSQHTQNVPRHTSNTPKMCTGTRVLVHSQLTQNVPQHTPNSPKTCPDTLPTHPKRALIRPSLPPGVAQGRGVIENNVLNGDRSTIHLQGDYSYRRADMVHGGRPRPIHEHLPTSRFRFSIDPTSVEGMFTMTILRGA